MVVRLGQTSNVEVVNSQRYRIKQGQALQLQYVSSETVTVRAWARVRYDTGEDDVLYVPDQTLGNDRVITLASPSDVARFDGWVTDALVEIPLSDSVVRGQVYARLFFDGVGPLLCKDYVYSNFGQIALGTYISDGPAGGPGNVEIVTVKAESAPAAATIVTLAATNEIRKITGFTWYYEASADAATRILTVVVRSPTGGRPTGLGAVDVWASAALTLTLSEGGGVFASEIRSGINDDGVIAIANVSSAPSPFPLWVYEDDPVTMIFATASLHANDLTIIYLLRESWVIEY